MVDLPRSRDRGHTAAVADLRPYVSDLAARIGAPGAGRAVAQACGANPLAVVIPCHRVVRRDGGLSGYHWGAERKRALLEKVLDRELELTTHPSAG